MGKCSHSGPFQNPWNPTLPYIPLEEPFARMFLLENLKSSVSNMHLEEAQGNRQVDVMTTAQGINCYTLTVVHSRQRYSWRYINVNT